MTVMTVDETPMPYEEAAGVLEAMILELQMRGWTQGQLMSDDGRVCLVGALQCAGGPTLAGSLAVAELRRQAIEVLVASGAPRSQVEMTPIGEIIPFWNDRVCRDIDQAVALVRATLERVRSTLQA